ncbi:Cu(I)/Ag(I) efflux system membrane fusion protein [Gillisia sp. Hel_I_86]|uniref:efflux RND transporter periplasmic adaptor subunit n=1 Tax=Gillisia sp. Hel_I_86 TaxID=1249981 RepID=UPI0011991F9D|nr:efflux RND transporter periplasmic adaptor subunit [Gillisia sp. Hel_I_86]TVZ26841.1 Cu(I)/Ag(I) efflux system membrane fusion protein [Gillisia sp. Hel_I_86]
MKKYKNYLIAAGILVIGIFLGLLFSGDKEEVVHKDGEHEYVQDEETGLWTCAMHPQIRMEEPGNCPICGMELIPLDESNNGDEEIASNEIVMSPQALQLANIQTSVVQKADASKEIRLLGRIKPDERKLFSQVSHIPGRIERLYVNFTGEKVYSGQKIARIYSPDLISAQKELLEAIRSREVYPQLYTASRNKLKLWKLSEAQLDAIEESGEVQEQIDILSDHSGYVMSKNVELGDYVKAGSNLFEIANLSTVWAMFEAYEADIPWINNGDVVDFTIQAIPGKKFQGKVTYVDPFVSSATRVAKVRVEVNNPAGKLLPEMYVNGIIQAQLDKDKVKDALVIPKSAVLWTGKRSVVYVQVPHEKTISFVYREITLGPDTGDFYMVAEGLEEGEVVVTNGVFRIDASAQLVGQKSMMNPDGGVAMTGHAGMDMGGGSPKTSAGKGDKATDHSKMEDNTDHTEMGKRISISKEFKNQLKLVFEEYLDLKDAFAGDDKGKAQKSAKGLLNTMSKVDMKLLKDHEAHNHWMLIQEEVTASAKSISEISEIGEQRKHFKHLSAHLIKAVKLFGVDQKVYEQFCPMADDNKGATWLSLSKDIKNPYLGEAMPTCGEVKSTIE